MLSINTFRIFTGVKVQSGRLNRFKTETVVPNTLSSETCFLQMKSVINQDITKAVTYGIESLCNIPVKLFLDCLRKFNRGRSRALRARLKEI